PRVAGVVVRELSVQPSNWRATGALADWLAAARVPLVADVDTRQLTRHIRSKGAMRGAVAVGEQPTDAVRTALAASPSMDGRDLADGSLPIFGICLGHQLLGLALGGETVKLPYGHRGGNHPVRDLATGQVLITSQNHGFAVRGDTDGVPGAKALEVTHLNLNDRTVEGVKHREYPIFAVQYHP